MGSALHANLKQALIFLVGLLSLFISNREAVAMDISLPSFLFEKLPHVKQPFSLAQKGYVLTTELVAGKKTYTYTFWLNFLVNEEELHCCAPLLGFGDPLNGTVKKDASGNFVSYLNGIRIPLKLTISRLDAEQETIVFNKEYDQLYSMGGNNSSLLKGIDKVKLEPATYRVRLETLESVPELAEIRVNFEIGLPGKH